MNIEYGMFQQQTLKLNMSQELVQAISLLQYTSMELAGFVEQIATENPLLEVEMNYYSTFSQKSLKKRKKQSASAGNFEAFIPDHLPSLSNYLQDQLLTKNLSSAEKSYVTFLINNLNDNGYLEIDIDEASRILNLPREIGKKALNIIQSLEPAGIGARNLQECIILQLRRNENADPRLIEIVEHYFDDFAYKKWKKIEKELNISLNEIQRLFDLVQTLEPRPGALISNERTEYVIPDIIIEKKEDIWHIHVAEDSYFHININEGYYHELMQQPEPMVKSYVKEKYQQIQWLKQSIEQRKTTMINMMRAIIEMQEPYLLGSKKELKPMTMNNVAEKIGVHESTISRIAKNKYARTPIGTIPLRKLFTTGAKTATGNDTISTEQVKNEIRDMIDQENKKSPYSDQEIVKLLEKKGIRVSRRTVTKYREQLKIPSSIKRKRYN